MGGAVSSGRDNNELIDNLMGGGYIRTRSVERVFRVLDRADYMTPTERDQAYKDLAWRSGALHLSAPCIYSEVVEALELKPGLSFLNIGSGTGYLSTLIGLLIGSGGTSHGVEIHPGVVEYSTKKLSQFQENSVTLDEFDFCIPKYYCGNALCLAPLQTLYDRVYVGAGVLPKYENYFKQLIKVKGVLVMPLGDTLVQIQRVSETEWTSRQLLNVSFALLRAPTKEESAEPLKLDELLPASLMLLCRATIRRAMLAGVCRRHPELREPPPRRPHSARPRPRRICIPLDADTGDAGLNALHDMEGEEGGREMNALLSLVLSMGNNRVAGSLRLADRPAPQPQPQPQPPNELEVLIDEIEQGSGSGSESGSSSSSESSSSSSSEAVSEPSGAPRERPSAAGATSPHPDRTDLVSGAVAVCPEARGSAPCEAAPGATASGTDLDALNPAGRVEVDMEPMMEPKPSAALKSAESSSSDDSKPSTSGKTPALAAAAGPSCASGSSGSSGSDGASGGGDSAGAGGGGAGSPRRRPRRRAHPHSKRFPAEQVQIYFGNAGVYADSDQVRGEEAEAGAEAEAEAEAEAAAEAAAAPGSDPAEMDTSSDEEPPSPKGQKRQKLDSGIGEGTASGSASSSRSDTSSHTDASTDNCDSVCSRGRRRAFSRPARGSAAWRLRRSQRDARRVRLSIVMKRAVKELPLPYALKKFVNLHRCFEF